MKLVEFLAYAVLIALGVGLYFGVQEYLVQKHTKEFQAAFESTKQDQLNRDIDNWIKLWKDAK